MEQSRSGPMVGRTVLATGASGGIGQATALGLRLRSSGPPTWDRSAVR